MLASRPPYAIGLHGVHFRTRRIMAHSPAGCQWPETVGRHFLCYLALLWTSWDSGLSPIRGKYFKGSWFCLFRRTSKCRCDPVV